ncbi:MAG: MATE family efflux transporter [Ruminococcaceae bacterium]|nr:MATE family efflux transporter [Oscillospiraceae bacterium]
MSKTQDFTTGKIFLPLLRFALPVLLSLFLQTMYGAVDLLIVGQFGGDLADVYVSAVSTGSQIMRTLTLMITSLAMGLTVYVGHKIGQGKREEAGRIIGSGIWLFALLAVVLSIIMLLAAPATARIMRAPQEAFSQTVSYILICSAGCVCIVAYNLIGSIFHGIGDSKTPLITVAIACVLNILGDLLLVAVFHMGAAGAAIATIAAQAVSVVISLLLIRRRALPFQFSIRYISHRGGHIRQILQLGVPIALQELLVSFSFLFITAIINDIGLTASAGVGVAEKMCGFLMLLPSSYMQAMSAFVAQNMGAGKPERARRALWCGIGSSLVAGIVMFYAAFFHGDLLAGIFAKDIAVILAAWDYLKAYAIDCLLTAFLFCFIGYFNGCGNTTFVMVQGILGAFCVRLPLAWLMSRQATVSLFHIGLSTPASTSVQILLCLAAFFLLRRKQKFIAPIS